MAKKIVVKVLDLNSPFDIKKKPTRRTTQGHQQHPRHWTDVERKKELQKFNDLYKKTFNKEPT